MTIGTLFINKNKAMKEFYKQNNNNFDKTLKINNSTSSLSNSIRKNQTNIQKKVLI